MFRRGLQPGNKFRNGHIVGIKEVIVYSIFPGEKKTRVRVLALVRKKNKKNKHPSLIKGTEIDIGQAYYKRILNNEYKSLLTLITLLFAISLRPDKSSDNLYIANTVDSRYLDFGYLE